MSVKLKCFLYLNSCYSKWYGGIKLKHFIASPPPSIFEWTTVLKISKKNELMFWITMCSSLFLNNFLSHKFLWKFISTFLSRLSLSLISTSVILLLIWLFYSFFVQTLLSLLLTTFFSNLGILWMFLWWVSS